MSELTSMTTATSGERGTTVQGIPVLPHMTVEVADLRKNGGGIGRG